MIFPTVSVIMPMYNAEKFVEEAVHSVISQTFQDWELIVVDDCSSDLSASIVERLAKEDERILLLHTDEPSGCPAIPRNIALKNAKGRYIAFLDSDDIWLPQKLEEQLPLFGEHSTKIVFSYYRKMNEDSSVTGGVVKSPDRVDYHQMLYGNVIGNLTGIFDTEKVGKPLFECIGHEDYVYWLHILREGGSAVNTKRVHAIYRLTPNSISRNKYKMLSWQWSVYRKSESLGLLRSAFYTVCYAIKGYIKACI